ncbi:MAG: GntR family transcriptional regulator [Sphingomonas sanxanigenens]|uniref:GntR family transcriptional regulator n=1 Tax=Sphingomonas sanxanigenens TaxID=397260 RepID=A0A2W5C3P7_9SPHN|nr:MAG: GntR family transcriptional regulator [Sphingomonas sanxanigenens]
MAEQDRPVYLQLRDRIAASILDGRYRDGQMLPSVRAFAAEQGANPLTVAKAYQLFQDEALILVKRGVGMFVAEGATARLRASEREAFLNDEWPRIKRTIDRLGLDAADLLDRADA